MDINVIIDKTVEFLENAPLHGEYAMSEAVRKACPDAAMDDDKMFDIHFAVIDRLNENGKRWTDFHKYDYEIVGLPYCIPFILRDTVTEPDLNPYTE